MFVVDSDKVDAAIDVLPQCGFTLKPRLISGWFTACGTPARRPEEAYVRRRESHAPQVPGVQGSQACQEVE